MGGLPEHPELWAFLEALTPGEELAWQRFDKASDVVHVGQRVTCELLQFDTWNPEAWLSLRAMQPDPFQEFADRVAVGQELCGEVTLLVPFGAFVRVADGVEGLVHRRDLTTGPAEAVADVVQVGEEIAVVVREIDLGRRRLSLSRQQEPPAEPR